MIRSLEAAVQVRMGEETHVPAIGLWNYAIGIDKLVDDDFEHLLFCIECQSLMTEFIDVVKGLPPVNRAQAA
jgi:hypothetical protein